jgi:hypothetical protein
MGQTAPGKENGSESRKKALAGKERTHRGINGPGNPTGATSARNRSKRHREMIRKQKTNKQETKSMEKEPKKRKTDNQKQNRDG